MTKKAAKPRRSQTARRVPKEAPTTIYYLLDSKGELFDVHTSRAAAFYDATGPRFYKGYFIVAYRRGSVRKYKYQATQREVTGGD